MASRLAVPEKSTEDQLVPMSQGDGLTATLSKVIGLRIAGGHRLTGSHAAAWEEGSMIIESLLDTLQLLRDGL